MKVFERDSKINFVDDNNVAVGFDYQSSCCEDFGYTFTRDAKANADVEEVEFDHDGWVFDASFMEDVELAGGYDEGSAVRFRLVNGDDEMFLVLYNHHNGYYGHGFDMLEDCKVIHTGCL